MRTVPAIARSLLSATTLAVLALASFVLPALAAKQKGHGVDLVTTAPDFASHGVKSIAILPVATFDGNAASEIKVAALLGKSLKDTGYRWISAGVARDLLRATLGDSTTMALRAEILANVRVDSLSAPRFCASLRTDALLSVRVEVWEQQAILWNQSGRPSTTVQLRAALVDSSGALLWSASGGETGEGAYQDPRSVPFAVRYQDPEVTPDTGQSGAPAYDDVLGKLFARWAPLFPSPAGTGGN